MKEFLRIDEAANLLGISTQTLRNWEKRGELIPYRNPVNNYRMYKVSQIEEFIEKMVVTRRRSGRFRLKVKVIDTKAKDESNSDQPE